VGLSVGELADFALPELGDKRPQVVGGKLFRIVDPLSLALILIQTEKGRITAIRGV
jgi:hypothetical protein